MNERFPSSYEHETAESTINFPESVKDILGSEAIASLPPEKQGQVIVDSFIGMLARRGEVQGSQKTYSVSEILSDMDGIQRDYDVRTITRNEGLRDAVVALASDERSAGLFGQLKNRVRTSETGELTLTTPEQVVSYLSHGDNNIHDARPGIEMSGDSWVSVVAERATDEASWIDNPYKGIIESDNDYLRNEGNKWRMAYASAQRAGVDMGLLARSSRYIARKKQRA